MPDRSTWRTGYRGHDLVPARVADGTGHAEGPGHALRAPHPVAIPAILNRGGGSADRWRDVIAADPRFTLVEVAPGELQGAVRCAISAGAPRVAVAGGDGSIASAAAVLVETDAEMAVLPAGTLNHFAMRMGIPTNDMSVALDVAAGGVATLVDVGFVGGLPFLNTSSVGAYTSFVRFRERLERALPYSLASLLAGLALFFRMPRFRVEVEALGEKRTYLTPLVFVGVGESDAIPTASARPLPHVPRGLHVIVVLGRRRARMLALGVTAARGGVVAVSGTPDVDSAVVDRCRIYMGGRDATSFAADGEMHRQRLPLDYRLGQDRLRVVLPTR